MTIISILKNGTSSILKPYPKWEYTNKIAYAFPVNFTPFESNQQNK